MDERQARRKIWLDRALKKAGLDHLPTPEELIALPVKVADEIAVSARDEHPELLDATSKRQLAVVEMRRRVMQHPHWMDHDRQRVMDEMIAGAAEGLPRQIMQAAAAEVKAEFGKRGRRPKGYTARSGADRARESRIAREVEMRLAIQALYALATPEQQEAWKARYPHAAKFGQVEEVGQQAD